MYKSQVLLLWKQREIKGFEYCRLKLLTKTNTIYNNERVASGSIVLSETGVLLD